MDLYPEDRNKISSSTLMRSELGGSSGNIAAGIVRLQAKAEALTMVSDDPVGEFVLNACKSYGIGTRYIFKAPPGSNTSLALAENRLNDFAAVIYRNNAADLALTMEQIDTVDFDEFDALVVTATALSQNPSRAATMTAMKRARYSVLDLDYRAAAWNNEQKLSEIYKQAIALSDIIVGNEDEFALIGGLDAARALGSEKLVIYKMGAKGALTLSKDASFATPVFKVDALKPVGAGDAFMAALLVSLGEGDDIARAVRYGAANAAIVVTRPACAPAMPTRIELEEFIKRGHNAHSTIC